MSASDLTKLVDAIAPNEKYERVLMDYPATDESKNLENLWLAGSDFQEKFMIARAALKVACDELRVSEFDFQMAIESRHGINVVALRRIREAQSEIEKILTKEGK